MKLNLPAHWYHTRLTWLTFFLIPFSFLYALIITIRKACYHYRLLRSYQINVPIIVVGNITVGGTGKTPFVIWLANWLQSRGYQPGIATRGVGGKPYKNPYCVNKENAVSEVGDEALLILQQTNCPVLVCIDRAAACRALTQMNCNIIICDDGLQHYRLKRNIEIVMVKNQRQFGNGFLLPAGPLREPISRLQSVDLIIENSEQLNSELSLFLQPQTWINLADPKQSYSYLSFPQKKCHAVAGIGHPQGFFWRLKNAGFEMIEHQFSDHHLYQEKELNFADGLPILMTEKDAIKCEGLMNIKSSIWYLSTQTRVSDKVEKELEVLLVKC